MWQTKHTTMDEMDFSELGILTKETIQLGLSQVEQSYDGEFGCIKLDLRGRAVKTLEGDLDRYCKLKYIDMSNNSVEQLYPIQPLKELHAINFKNNNLTDLGDFSEHTKLQVVELDNNQIASLNPFTFFAAKAITVSNNELTSLDLMLEDGEPALEVLDASFNRLKTTRGVKTLPNLRVLNVKSNAIKDLDDIGELTQLQQLDLSNNKLPNLEVLAALTPLKDLFYLATAGNAGIYPDGATPESLIPGLLIILPQLKKWDDLIITEEHYAASAALKEERDAAAAEKAAEEAAAAAAAAAEAEEAAEDDE